jgi:hypothetical protein
VIWLSISGVVEHAETGKPMRAYGILQDITEGKAYEEQIHLLMREVNHRAKNHAQSCASDRPPDRDP